jgi:hypothetical protein
MISLLVSYSVTDQNRNKIYYWLIVQDRKLVLKPMNEQEFDNASLLYEVPETLNFKLVE